MATTTNYGWETPDDTDLVKDGAAAIRTLGNSVDTTTKNLNPETTTGDIAYRSATANVNTRLAIGTTGQVLTVAGGVPSWATPSDQTPLTTKGDLFTFSTVDARLGVGSNGQALVAASGEATGLKWGNPNYVGVGVTHDATIAFTANVANYFAFTTESFDTNSFHDNSTNPSRITIPAGYGGKYLFSGFIGIGGAGSNSFTILLRKNGSANAVPGGILNLQPNNAGNTATDSFAVVIELIATDYIELGLRLTSTTNYAVQSAFSATFLGA